MSEPVPSPADLSVRVSAWLDEHDEALAPYRLPLESFDARVDQLKKLQRELFDAGWVRYGWPTELAGLGGNELHRAAVYEALADAGYPPRSVFEHLDIIIPTLARFAPELAVDLVPRMMRGDELWCQGFSEPEAGSDLAALRTRADRDGDGFVLRGHKIWTSWAKWARRCMVLARTGAQDDRHRALTMMVVDIDTPGLTVRPIVQSNGTPELAEVFFDDVPVAASQVVGEVDGGWAIAMYLLSCERGSYPWQRHEFLRARLATLSSNAQRDADHERLGHAYSDLFAVRTRAWSTQCALARGEVPGPEAAVNKILITETEQTLYDAASEILGHGIQTGLVPEAWRWQEDFLFSRATSIYGGSRQIQLTVVARHLIGHGAGSETEPGWSDWVDSITQAVRESPTVRDALDGLGWWDVSGACADGDGRIGFGALFEVLGRELAVGPALGAVLSAPILEASGGRPNLDSTYAVVVGESNARLDILAPGGPARDLVVKLPSGWGRVSADAIRWSSSALDKGALQVGSLDPEAIDPLDVRGDVQALEERCLALGRTAICFEILGASTILLDAATEHTRTRRQFGKPLADFQAVQHLLAEAHVELAALRELCHALLAPDSENGPEPEAAALAKLRGGRAGRTIAQRCLQAFGAIGFTEEHLHHRYARRIMTLDAFLGGGSELARRLGARAAQSGQALKGLPFDSLRGARGPEST
ncbi:MAG: acyl-CoA dehydrogenase family protein [Candidatus Binatia bacterium]|nr:acyl-CoA dehydrogenase family protein [Candidatus Binatia bacterium]